MQRILGVVTGVAAAILTATAVQANTITGDIGFLGFSGASTSGGVTTFSPDNPWIVLGGTDSYSQTAGSLATFSAISYTGTGTAAKLTSPVDPLWSFSLLGLTYSFDLSSLLSADVTANSVDLSGTGTALITGYTPTAATWSLEGSGANEEFEIDFSATGTGSGSGTGSGQNVPDGGTTAAMLGLALGACGLFARKSQRA
jgi:hypothetical protein